jgi:hypothetical protein
MRDGAIERMNAASRGGNKSTPSNAARIPKLFRNSPRGADKHLHEPNLRGGCGPQSQKETLGLECEDWLAPLFQQVPGETCLER